MIRPAPTFACVVLWQRTVVKKIEKSFQEVQRLAYLGITGCIITTAIEAFVDLQPLHIF